MSFVKGRAVRFIAALLLPASLACESVKRSLGDDVVQHCLGQTLMTATIGAALGVSLADSKASKTAAGILAGAGAGTATFLICRRAYLQAIELKEEFQEFGVSEAETTGEQIGREGSERQLTISTQAANIRKGPGTEYSSMMVAREGEAFEILGKVKSWYIVLLAEIQESGTRAGFVHTSTVQLTSDEDGMRHTPGGGVQFLNDIEVIDNRAIRLDLNSSLLFQSGSRSLSQDFFSHLNVLSSSLKKYDKSKIAIIGHTDNQGNSEDNLRLSRQRAELVADYLIDQGVSRSRFEVRGVGSTEPIADNSTEEGRALNRRVEIVIVPQEGEE